VLTIVDPTDASWTWGGTNPAVWSVQEATAENGPWGEVDQQPGSARTSPNLSSGQWARIVGQDLLGNDVTNPSNVLFEGL
jgi:hypothetical protein